MSPAAGSVVDGRHNPWLDLVRSIAILLVLFRHGQGALNAEMGPSQGFLQTIAINGWVGVDLFFVLSGYLIARHLLGAGIGSGRFQLGRYVTQRALRIVPAYYAALLLVVIGAFPLYPVTPEALGPRIAYHLLFLQDYLPSNINVVFWSLGVEEKFYLLAPVIVLALLRCRSAALLSVLLLALFLLPLLFRGATYAGVEGEMSYPQFWRTFRSPFHMALEGLIIGLSIALLEHRGLVSRSPRLGLATLSAASLIFAGWLASHDFMVGITGWDVFAQPLLIAVLAGLMVLGAAQLSGTALPAARAFNALSRLSYSLYLMHFPLLPMAILLARAYSVPVFWIGYLAMSVVAALLLHLGVERPFLIWKDRLSQSDRARQSGTLPAGGRLFAPADEAKA